MSEVWFESYPAGVPRTIDPEQYSSIVDILEEAFREFPQHHAFSCMGTSLTYAEIEHASRRFASFLQNDLNLSKGERVALMMPNILQYPIALFGVLRAGMVAVNVNPLYTERELKHQLCDSGAKAIVIFENACHTLEKVLPETPVEQIFVTAIGDFLDFPKGAVVNFVLRHIKKMVPPWHLPGSKKFKDCLESANGEDYRPPNLSLRDTAFLQYTGGTTGVSKGAVLSHGNIVANVVQARAWIGGSLRKGGEIVITPLPFYHIFSLTANCLIFSTLGAHNILITNPRDIEGFVKELAKWKFTALTGVNTLFNALINHPQFAELDFSALKISLGGGMAVQRAVAEKWKAITGVPLIEAYGLTETSPAACINPMDLADYNGKIGLPIPSTEMRILDDDGNPLPAGEIGEIAIRGPQVMQGYWNRPEETAVVMTADGFFKTGDIGTMDDRGFFQIVDRKKDMILVSGFNVFPNEIEDVLVGHPQIVEAAAIGVPDQKSGEAVKAFVVCREPAPSEEELRAFCKERLTAYKVPRSFEFRSELPKSNVGKILRKELRKKSS